MANSETWRAYWRLKDDFNAYIQIAQAANLAIDTWNPHMHIWTPICDGDRHVPYCLCANMDSNSRPWIDFDLRNHPYWKEAFAFFPAMFAEQCNKIRPGSMQMSAGVWQFVKPMTGMDLTNGIPYQASMVYGYRALLEVTNEYADEHPAAFAAVPIFQVNTRPQWVTDAINNRTFADPKFRAWNWSWGYGPLLPYPREEDYWTQSELEEQYENLAYYLSATKEALSWWLVLHNLSPGSYIDYLTDLEVVIERINMAEQGDPLAIALLESSGQRAADISPAGESPYAEGVTLYNVGDFLAPPDADALTSQAGFLDKYKNYWPYAAAAGVVGAALLARGRK